MLQVERKEQSYKACPESKELRCITTDLFCRVWKVLDLKVSPRLGGHLCGNKLLA